MLGLRSCRRHFWPIIDNRGCGELSPSRCVPQPQKRRLSSLDQRVEQGGKQASKRASIEKDEKRVRKCPRVFRPETHTLLKLPAVYRLNSRRVVPHLPTILDSALCLFSPSLSLSQSLSISLSVRDCPSANHIQLV